MSGLPSLEKVLRRRSFVLAGLAAVPALALWLTCGATEREERIPARSGGELAVDLTLGGGLAFDKGSLAITSHEASEVRVLVEQSGWGQYAVDVEVRETDSGVRVVGQVEGFLHWILGGPSVDVRVWVPPNYAVDAGISGGPLVLEDLRGSVVARLGGGDEGVIQPVGVTLRRVEGAVRIVSEGGFVLVEDVEGALEIDGQERAVEIANVRGRLKARTTGGAIKVTSLDGPAELSTDWGPIEVDRVRGNLRISSHRGSIRIAGAEGDVAAKTDAGRIEIADLAGDVMARSGIGAIHVAFLGDPAGSIETEQGSIAVSIPEDASFDLDARADEGVDLDSAFALVPDPAAVDVAAGPERGEDRRAGKVNGGGRALQLRARQGSIDIDDRF